MLVKDGWEPKVGDLVRIRQWDDMAREFGLNEYGSIKCDFSFIEAMKHLCGVSFIITSIENRKVYGLREANVTPSNFNISFDMIELFDEDYGDDDVDSDTELLSFISEFSLTS